MYENLGGWVSGENSEELWFFKNKTSDRGAKFDTLPKNVDFLGKNCRKRENLKLSDLKNDN